MCQTKNEILDELKAELSMWQFHLKDAEEKGLTHTANYCRKFIGITEEQIKKYEKHKGC